MQKVHVSLRVKLFTYTTTNMFFLTIKSLFTTPSKVVAITTSKFNAADIKLLQEIYSTHVTECVRQSYNLNTTNPKLVIQDYLQSKYNETLKTVVVANRIAAGNTATLLKPNATWLKLQQWAEDTSLHTDMIKVFKSHKLHLDCLVYESNI